MWERIDDETDRLWVAGGWLVRTKALDYSQPTIPLTGVAMVFVEDIFHQWALNTNQESQA